VAGGEVADGEFGCGRVEEQLVLGQLNVLLRGVDDALRAALERRFKLCGSAVHAARVRRAYQWDDFGGVLRQVLRQLVVVDDEVGDVNVAVVLLDKHILAHLVSAQPLALAHRGWHDHVYL
jgi:hypothetical protein